MSQWEPFDVRTDIIDNDIALVHLSVLSETLRRCNVTEEHPAQT